MRRGLSVSDCLRPLAEAPCQAYLSDILQVADLLEWILGQTGPAEVWLTSFSISEEFLRRIFHISRSGLVSRLTLVLDHKATNKTLGLWAFLSQVVENTYLADNHSKLLLVRGVNGDVVSVVTSQNLTRGNRHESAFVSTDPDVFSSLSGQVRDLIDNHSVALHELFRNRIEEN